MHEILYFKGPYTTATSNRDLLPDRGYGCGWLSAHTHRNQYVQSFSVYAN